MKKILIITGILSVNFILFGTLFKSMHWPGASILLGLGVLIFCFFVLPASLMNHYKGNDKKRFWLYFVIFLTVFLNFMAFAFKMMHWPGAGLMFMFAIPMPFVLFLPVYIYHHNKSKEPSNTNFLSVVLLLIFIAIFTAFTAVGVSKNFLNNFIQTGNEMMKSNNAIEKYNAMKYEKSENKPEEFHKRSEEVNAIIAEAKSKIVDNLNDMSHGNIKYADIKYPFMSGFENLNIGWYFMIYEDGERYAFRMKEKLNDVEREFQKAAHSTNVPADNLLDTGNIVIKHEGYTHNEAWEDWYFRKTQLISVLNHLTLIETNVALVEMYVLEN